MPDTKRNISLGRLFSADLGVDASHSAMDMTTIYPFESPGGWNIIGRTPLASYDPTRREPFLFRPGDRVRFRPVALSEFQSTACLS